MIFQTLILENVFSHKHTEIELNNRGLTLITGDNGAGKSSILKALLFCLFGIGTDSVVNKTIDADACVTLIGVKNKDSFRVSRYRKHKKYKNDLHFFINEEPVDAATNTDLQKKLEKYLGLDYRAFLNVAAFSSEMVQFCSSTDVERKAIFEKILQDLDIYGEYHKTAKEEYITLTVEADDLKHKIEVEQRELSVVKKVIESEETRLEEMQKVREAEVDKLKEKLASLYKSRAARDKLQEKKERYEKAEGTLELFYEGMVDYSNTWAKNRGEIEMWQQYHSQLDKGICEFCHQEITEKHRKKEQARISKEIKKMEKLDDEFTRKCDIYDKVRDKVQEIGRRIESVTYKLTKYDDIDIEIETINRQKKELESATDNSGAIQQWKSKNKKISKKIASYKNRIKKVEEELVYLDEVVKGFSKTGIPNVIISRALHFLEERSNKYLDILTNGAISIRLSGFATTKKGAVRNKIDIEVVSANGVTAYEAYSGGERQRLNISMLLALRDVAQANKGVDLNCIFLDEVLDLSLDFQGANDVLMLLQHKKKDIESIFIISPKEEFIKNSSGNFDTLLQVYKENGFSKIVGG